MHFNTSVALIYCRPCYYCNLSVGLSEIHCPHSSWLMRQQDTSETILMTDGNLEVITGHQLNLLSSESNKSVRTSTENVINIIIIIDQSPTILHIRFTLHTDTWHVTLYTDTWHVSMSHSTLTHDMSHSTLTHDMSHSTLTHDMSHLNADNSSFLFWHKL